MKRAVRGQMASGEVAGMCGISRGHLFEWIKSVRAGGLDVLLKVTGGQDLIKDELGNFVLHSVECLREALLPVLREWWGRPERVLSLIGRAWLQSQANTSSKTLLSAN